MCVTITNYENKGEGKYTLKLIIKIIKNALNKEC